MLIAAALLAAFGLRSHAAVAGPVLVVRTTAHKMTPARRPDADERAMALAAASMAPSDHAHVLELLDLATARLEARLSPLGTDFEESDPVEQLQRSLQQYLPVFTAARDLERGTWASDDLAVRVSTSCEAAHLAPDERCLPLRDGPGAEPPSPEVKRARFLAWAASHAKIVDLGTPARAAACARTLREKATEALSPIALVLRAPDLALGPSDERATLQAAALRLGRAIVASGREAPKDLEAFARVPKQEAIAPWLALSDTQVVVVPRLSALAHALPVDCE
jgi:hypothetical protein